MITDKTLLSYENIKHGFFTRKNGFSEGVFKGLNMRRGSADNPEHIEKNYQYVKNTLALDALLTLKQTHSNKVITVTHPWSVAQRPEGDAMVTNLKNVGLGILTADCGPLLLTDPVNNIIGAAHLGRKGALHHLLKNTIEAMENLGAKRHLIYAALGPTISKDNYDVGLDVYQEIIDTMPDKITHLETITPHQHYKLDMPALIGTLCTDIGIKFQSLDLCTYANQDLFFSYRRSTHQQEKNYGCCISVIGLI